MRWTKNWSKKMKGGVAVGAVAVAIMIGVSVANTGGEDSAARLAAVRRWSCRSARTCQRPVNTGL